MRHPAEGEDPVGDTVLVQLLSKWSQRAFSAGGTTAPSPPTSSPTAPANTTHNAIPLAATCTHPPLEHLPLALAHSHTTTTTTAQQQQHQDGTQCTDSRVPSVSDPHTAAGMACPPPQVPTVGCNHNQIIAKSCTTEVNPFTSPLHQPGRLHDDPHLAFHISTCAPTLVQLALPHSRGTRAVPATCGGGIGGNTCGKRDCTEVCNAGAAECSTGEDSEHHSQKRRRTEANSAIGGSVVHLDEHVRAPLRTAHGITLCIQLLFPNSQQRSFVMSYRLILCLEYVRFKCSWCGHAWI